MHILTKRRQRRLHQVLLLGVSEHVEEGGFLAGIVSGPRQCHHSLTLLKRAINLESCKSGQRMQQVWTCRGMDIS